MGSAFFEFNVASSALFVAKGGLAVTSHNIANAATKGYTRQEALQRATTPMSTNDGRGMLGTGAEIYGVGQTRSFYLDKKFWSESGVQGEYATKETQLNLLETVFNASSESGLSTMMTDYFKRMSDLTFSASDPNYRSSVITYSGSLTTSLQTTSENLKKQQRDLNQDLEAVVDRVNSIGVQVASLNKQIYRGEIGGETANDLRDQRARLVDELSTYVNVDVKETDRSPNGDGSDKQFSILINGQELVNHFDTRSLKLEPRTTPANPEDVPGLYDVMWNKPTKDANGNVTDPGIAFNTDNMSGQMKGILDVRDGKNASGANTATAYKGIPYYLEKLNNFARTFAKAVNEGTDRDGNQIPGVIGHVNGYDSYGNTGTLFFSYKGSDGTIYSGSGIDYSKITAGNISLSKEILDDPQKLATSKGKDQSDNEVILGVLKLKDNGSLFKEGNLYDYIAGSSAELGVDTKQAQKFTDYYKEVVDLVGTQRMQVSSVSLNEEMVNMLKYQQLYQAAAKLISTINSIYDVTINGLGM